MKKASFFWLLISLALSLAAQKTASDPALNQFGKAFVAALARQDVLAMKDLQVTEAEARATLQNAGISPEEIEPQLNKFKEALPSMLFKLEKSYAACMEGLPNAHKAKFVRIERESYDIPEGIQKMDLFVFFKIKRKEYMADVDDCILTVNGWRMTAKFNLK